MIKLNQPTDTTQKTTATTTKEEYSPSSSSSIVSSTTSLSSSLLCNEMVANEIGTELLLKKISSSSSSSNILPPPYINVGFPKMGSTTLNEYFMCGGIRSLHWNCGKLLPPPHNNKPIANNLCAVCMKFSLFKSRPLLKSCGMSNTTGGALAFTQIDYEWGKSTRGNQSRYRCYFPQMDLNALNSIHKESPNATFIMFSRPFDDWIASLGSWYNNTKTKSMRQRLIECADIIPGLEIGRDGGSSSLLSRKSENENEHEKEQQEYNKTNQQFKKWVCQHQVFIRNFVKQYPSHALVELDLYDNRIGDILSKLVGIPADCFGHANKKRISFNQSASRLAS